MRRKRKRGENGKPWLRTLPNGTKRWYVKIVGRQEPLRKKDGTFINGPEKEGEALRAWHEMMVVAAAPITGAENPVRVVLDLYLQRHLEKNGQPKTLTEYVRVFKSFTAKYPNLRVSELRKHHVEKWWEEHPKWGPSMRNFTGTALKAALNWAAGAESDNLIPANPLNGMKLPQCRSRGAEALISDEDHDRLIAIVPEDLRNVLIALRAVGTRPSNVWRSTAKNFDEKQNVLIYAEWNTPPDSLAHKTAKKTGRPLVVPLTDGVADLCRKLKAQLPDGDERPLFRTASGEPWDAQKLANRLRWYKKKLGLTNVICYGYRHTLATDLLEQGVPDAEVAALLGHRNTAMIYRHYGHLGARIQRLNRTLNANRRPTKGEQRLTGT